MKTTSLERARQALSIALLRMASRYPFHAGLVRPDRLVVDDTIKTMAVTIREARLLFLFCPDFVNSCTHDQLVGVLMHEINHVLFGHLFLMPEEFPDQEALIIAEEVTVNEFVSEPLPDNVITLSRYPQLPPRESTKIRYGRLAREQSSGTDRSGQVDSIDESPSESEGDSPHDENDQTPPNSRPAVPKTASSAPKTDPKARKKVPKGPKSVPQDEILGRKRPRHAPSTHENEADSRNERSESLSEKKSQSEGGSPEVAETEAPQSPGGITPIDDHAVWDECRQHSHLGKAIVASAIERAMESLSPQERQRVTPVVRDQIEHCLRSVHPGNEVHAIEGQHSSGMDWRSVLRRAVNRILERQPSLQRPSRRLPDLVGIVPGYASAVGRHRIMVAVDTSFSISPTTLEQISGEVERIARNYEVIVVECDSIIQSIAKFQGRLNEVQGRGGTDLRPPFDRKILRQVEPSAIVYFTDGGGPWPERAPRGIPTIWCLVGDKYQRPTWGKVIEIPDA